MTMTTIFDARPRADWTRDVEPVFLVGAPRSGTTWLQAMLASHPGIYTGPETFFFSTFGGAEREFLRPKERKVGLGEYLSEEEFHGFMAELFWRSISALPPPAAKPRFFLEKTTHHAEHGDFILKTFPRARFIHLVRDARAVVASLLRASKGWGKTWAPSRVRRATLAWSELVLKSRSIRSIVPHPSQYTEVKYEELRRAPELRLADLFLWIGVEADDAFVAHAVEENKLGRTKNRGFASIPATAQSGVTPIADTTYPEGFFGLAPYTVEDVQLNWLQRRHVERLAGDLLRDLGYLDDAKAAAAAR
jgi:hypothetical protein